MESRLAAVDSIQSLLCLPMRWSVVIFSSTMMIIYSLLSLFKVETAVFVAMTCVCQMRFVSNKFLKNHYITILVYSIRDNNLCRAVVMSLIENCTSLSFNRCVTYTFLKYMQSPSHTLCRHNLFKNQNFLRKYQPIGSQALQLQLFIHNFRISDSEKYHDN